MKQSNTITCTVLPSGDFSETLQSLDSSWYTSIDEVYYCRGPGRFVSLRCGVMLAKSISEFTNANLFSFSLFDYFRAVVAEEKKDLHCIFQANSDVYFLDEERVSIESIQILRGYYVGEIKSLSLFPHLISYNVHEQWLTNKQCLQYIQDCSVKGADIFYGVDPHIGAS